jgi:hypothetical protein
MRRRAPLIPNYAGRARINVYFPVGLKGSRKQVRMGSGNTS